jgi:hypothetical protein
MHIGTTNAWNPDSASLIPPRIIEPSLWTFGTTDRTTHSVISRALLYSRERPGQCNYTRSQWNRMKIENMNKQIRQTGIKILYRAIVIGTLVWGAIYSTIMTGTLWLIVPVIGVYSLMVLLLLEATCGKLLKRRKKQDIGDKSLPNPLHEMQRTSTPHLSFPTGAKGANLQERDQAVAKPSKKTAA